MCGICGIINRDRFGSVNIEVLKKMSNKISHRGPDDEGFYLNRNIGMAVRRLSIIDIAGGHQPISNEDGSVIVVYNGEIYNHSDLREELKEKGHHFKSQCDTEILVHLYEEYRNDLFKKINGMFAFCLYDLKSNRIIISRDRVGIKPLYYTTNKNFFMFGSEIKSFLEVPDFGTSLDLEALHHYLTFRFVPAPWTLFKNVRKLYPGHFIEYDLVKDYLRVTKYWDLDYKQNNSFNSLKESSDAVKNLVKDSTRIRLMSEVPLGTMLSGGIDSSILVACMNSENKSFINTFTISYNEEGPHNENEFANVIAKFFDTDHHEINISLKDFMLQLERVVYYMDEPIADPAAIPIFDLCRYAKNNATVLLSGIGSDEIFAGYNVYKEAIYSKYAECIPYDIWKYLILPLSNLMPNGTLGKNYIIRARKPLEDTFLGSSFIYGGFSESAKQFLYHDNLKENQKDLNSHDIVKETLRNISSMSKLQKMMYFDTKYWLADSHLMMIDKMSMAHSIEARAPFLDHRLVELLQQIPDAHKLNAFQSKIVLKNAFKDAIPCIIRKRSKRGFSTPLQIWLQGMGKELSHFVCSTENRINNIFDAEFLKKLIFDHQTNKGDFSASIFAILVLECWMKKFLN